ncbi:MAG: glycosyltransferase family 2 protein [Phycisphaerales bacterium]
MPYPQVQPVRAPDASSASGGRPRSNIEVVIPAFNEEVNLPHALRSVVGWADRVWVVDSESTDRTRDIATQMGASVVVQPWLGYARQKNWALDNLPFQSDWVFILDSDEAITDALREEMLGVAGRPASGVPEAGYYVNRLTYFLNRPIRHCGYYPSYNLRFFKRGRARYEEREVHEHMIVDGTTARLRHDMTHEDRRGLEHLIAKHNRYSTLEARELRREQLSAEKKELPELERGIALRRFLKRNVLPKLPLSGLWRFMYMYVLRLGFLDGVAGLRFCLLLSTYDLFISLKLAEQRALPATADGAPVPAPSGNNRGGLAIPEGDVGPTSVAHRAEKTAPFPAAPSPAVASAATPAPPTPTSPVAPTPTVVGAPVAEARRADADRLAAELSPTRMPPGAFPAVKSVAVSILVPVKNEQRNIVECLRRCQWATELVVVDSQSSDKTIELSQAMGADVYQFHYDRSTGWPKKKNWALDQVPWKNEWVMILDADEYMTPELAQEIRRVVEGGWRPEGKFAQGGCGDGYWVNRRFMFMGQWIKGCGYYPSWNVRLLKHRLGRYERIGALGDTGSGDNEVHEHIVLSTGAAGYLSNEFLHYAYPDLSAWIEKHNRYTTWEAHAMEAKDEGAVRAKFFGEPIERRRWIKRFGRKLPFRPTLRFFYSYIFQKGFLDGYPGIVMCRLLAWYEFMSIAKHREMQAQRGERARREAAMTSGRPS